MRPKISIIIPIYKAEKFIYNCLDSIINQTFTDWEALLIDDGSPDNSGLICDEYATKDSRFKVFHKNNGGVSSARNLGLENAQGEWVTFVDADDWIEQNVLSIVKDIQSKPSVDFIQYGYQRVANNCITHSNYLPAETLHLTSDEYCNTRYYHCGCWGYFIKRELIEKYQVRFPTNIKYGEDQAFILKMLLLSKECYVSNIYGYNYFDNPGSAMNAGWNIERIKNSLDAIEDVIKFSELHKINLPQLHKYTLSRFAKSYIWWATKSIKNYDDFINIREIYNKFIKAISKNDWGLYKYNNMLTFSVLYIIYKLGIKK